MADDEYLTPAEFAALSTGEQISVWQAHAAGRVSAIPVYKSAPGGARRYHREQVRRLLAETCGQCKGTGLVDVDHCNCAVGPGGYYGMHERYCGTEMCPNGCWDVLHPELAR